VGGGGRPLSVERASLIIDAKYLGPQGRVHARLQVLGIITARERKAHKTVQIEDMRDDGNKGVLHPIMSNGSTMKENGDLSGCCEGAAPRAFRRGDPSRIRGM